MQDQCSVTDQLNSLIDLAHKNGLYDAADWVRARLESDKHKLDVERAALHQRKTVRVEPATVLNPRQEKLLSKFTAGWHVVRMNMDREDLVHFERLGLIELRSVPGPSLPSGIEVVYTEGRRKP